MTKQTIFLLILLIPLICFAQKVIVITNVAVVDVKKNKLNQKRTVIIEGNKITSVSTNVSVPENAIIIDGKGKYLIPGLWDMHVHTLQENRPDYFFPLFIASGITGIRDMGGTYPIEKILEIRKNIEAGKIVGPRILFATRMLDGSVGTRDNAMPIHTPEEGKEYVKLFKQQGSDFIKVLNVLPKDIYLAIISEAKKQNISVVGHVPFSMTAAEVSDLGQKSIEHTTDLFISCSNDEPELRAEIREGPKTTETSDQVRTRVEMKAVDNYDEHKASNLFAHFIRNKTWQCPTLVVRRISALDSLGQAEHDDRLKYIPASVRQNWSNIFSQRIIRSGTSEQRKKRFRRTLQVVGAMQRAGVGILAGTDVLNPYAMPGFSIHDELQLLTQAGLSPAEALRTATINPAIFFGKEKELGTVEKGKWADLVILDGNPLVDINNTKKISAVIVNGRLLQRKDLDALLQQAKDTAGK